MIDRLADYLTDSLVFDRLTDGLTDSLLSDWPFELLTALLTDW